jgi:hypothetical protein
MESFENEGIHEGSARFHHKPAPGLQSVVSRPTARGGHTLQALRHSAFLHDAGHRGRKYECPCLIYPGGRGGHDFAVADRPVACGASPYEPMDRLRFKTARQAEIEAVPISYVVELVGVDTDSDAGNPVVIALMVLCCDPLAIALTAAVSAPRSTPPETTFGPQHLR